MRKKFAANLIFLLAANLLVKPYFIFGVDRVVQNRVGPDEYGTYFAVFNYSFLFSIILDFGINNFNNRAISRSPGRLGSYLLNLLMLKLVLSIIYLVFTFLSAWASGFSQGQLQMLLVLAVNQILLSAILYFRSNLAALQFFKTDAFVSILDRLLTIGFCSLLLFAPAFKSGFSVMWFIYAQTAALAITALVAFMLVAGKTVLQFNWWNSRYTRTILLRSAPFALLALLMGIYYRIDAVMIERMLPDGAHQAGIYAASFRLLDAANMFGYLFATLLLPLFAAMLKSRENVQPLVKLSGNLMFAGSLLLGCLCYFFSAPLMKLMYPASNAYWWQIFGWLMFNFIPMGSIYIYGTLLTAGGQLKALNLIALGGAVLNVGLNLFLIPRYGALGATWATLLTQGVAAIAHLWVAARVYALGISLSTAVRLALFALVCTIGCYVTRFVPVNWVGQMALAAGLTGVAATALQLVPVTEALAVLRKRGLS